MEFSPQNTLLNELSANQMHDQGVICPFRYSGVVWAGENRPKFESKKLIWHVSRQISVTK